MLRIVLADYPLFSCRFVKDIDPLNFYTMETIFLVFKNNEGLLDYFSGTNKQVQLKIKTLISDDWEIQTSQEGFDEAYKYFRDNPKYLNL